MRAYVVGPTFLERLKTSPFGKVAPATWYEAFAPNTPDLMVIRLPEEIVAARPGLPTLRRTLKVLFAEDRSDRAYLDDCLSKPLPFVDGVASFRRMVDATNVRRSTYPTSRDMRLLHYAPPADKATWPHVTIMMSGMHVPDAKVMRGRYVWFASPDEAAAVAQLTEFAHQAGMAGTSSLRVLSSRDTANA